MDNSLTTQAILNDEIINNNFKIKFGYDIPQQYELTPQRKAQLEQKRAKTHTIKTVNLCSQPNTNTVEIKETAIELHEEKKRLKEKVTTIQSKIETMIAANEILKNQLALQSTLQPIPPQPMQKKKFSQPTPPQRMLVPQKKLRAEKKREKINGQKKSIIIKNQKPSLPLHNPNNDIPQQKLRILRYLFKKYNVQTTMQLTEKFCKQCDIHDFKGICGRYNSYCTWDYNFLTKELTFDTDDSASCCCSYDCKHPAEDLSFD